jgi:hypothetical protein
MQGPVTGRLSRQGPGAAPEGARAGREGRARRRRAVRRCARLSGQGWLTPQRARACNLYQICCSLSHLMLREGHVGTRGEGWG